MSSTYIGADLRRLVISRAGGICEYCLIHQDDTLYGCEVDHVISEKHGGPTVEDNLALACLFCNRRKGSDLGSISRRSGELVRFYNPRADRWADHFRLDGIVIMTITGIGEVTERIFELNDPDRLLERSDLQRAGRYPSAAARRRIEGATP